jgi:hypothetical protein
MLFKQRSACDPYKWLQKIYDFKNKVLLVMKSHYERVSAPGGHSSSNDPRNHEDLLELNQLCLHLYVEYQEAFDIQEAIRCDNLLEMENFHNASPVNWNHQWTFSDKMLCCHDSWLLK